MRSPSIDMLQEMYTTQAMPALIEKFGYENRNAIPRLKSVVVNTGFARLVAGKTGDDQKKTIEAIVDDLSRICGQKAVVTKAKKSIAGFKLRQGSPVGAKITLRGKRMYDFLERLILIALPRSRDFQGLNATAIDQQGNLSIGIKEHIFFPEISPEKVRNIFGLQVVVTTSAHNKAEGLELLKQLGFPLKEIKDKK